MNAQKAVEQLRTSGLGDKQIADAIGCGTSTVSMWATGKRANRTGDYMFKLFQLHSDRCARQKRRRVETAA